MWKATPIYWFTIDYYFSHHVFLAHPIFFRKYPSNNIIRIWVFSTLGEKNEFFTNLDFIIRKPTKIGRYLILSDYRIQTPPKHLFFFMVLMQLRLHNPNCTSTNSEHVCNMNSHFKDNIILPNSHPCVFGSRLP